MLKHKLVYKGLFFQGFKILIRISGFGGTFGKHPLPEWIGLSTGLPIFSDFSQNS